MGCSAPLWTDKKTLIIKQYNIPDERSMARNGKSFQVGFRKDKATLLYYCKVISLTGSLSLKSITHWLQFKNTRTSWKSTFKLKEEKWLTK